MALAASASAPAASLNVTTTSDASDCPTQEAWAAAINGVAGHVAVAANDTAAAATRLTLAVIRVGGVYRAVLHVEGPFGGERIFEDNGISCAALASAVSVSTALLLDQIESSKSSERKIPDPVAPRPKPWKYGVELGGNVSAGLTRPASLGYSLESFVGRSQFMGGVGGLWMPSRGDSAPPGEVLVGLLAITARGCWVAQLSRGSKLDVWLCARGLGGWVHASARGFDGARDVRKPWLGAAGDVSLTGPIFGPLHWVLSLDGVVPVVDQRFTVTVDGNRTVAFDPAQAGVLGGLGLMVSNF